MQGLGDVMLAIVGWYDDGIFGHHFSLKRSPLKVSSKLFATPKLFVYSDKQFVELNCSYPGICEAIAANAVTVMLIKVSDARA